METDGKHLQVEVYQVVGLAEVFLCGEEVHEEGQRVEHIFYVDEVLEGVDVVGHEDDVVVGGGL